MTMSLQPWPSKITNNFTIFYRTTNIKLKEFGVCVMTPLFNMNDQYLYKIVNFIEIIKVFGTEWFTFYIGRTVGRKIVQALKYYTTKGLLETVNFIPPSHYPTFYHAQEVAFNDCLYRNLHMVKYLADIDIDEIPVPLLYSNWHLMIENLTKHHQEDYCAFMFSNVFMNSSISDHYINHMTTKQQHYKVKRLLWNLREQQPWNYRDRSKNIVDVRYAEMVMVHIMNSCLFNKTVFEIPPDHGLLYHYRDTIPPDVGMPPICTVDERIMEFEKKILQNIDQFLIHLIEVLNGKGSFKNDNG